MRALATLSEMVVLKDLLPTYRIRLPTAREKEMKVSVEVRAVRQYEAALLTAYQSFLKHLEACVKTGTARWASPHERGESGGVSVTWWLVSQLVSQAKKVREVPPLASVVVFLRLVSDGIAHTRRTANDE